MSDWRGDDLGPWAVCLRLRWLPSGSGMRARRAHHTLSANPRRSVLGRCGAGVPPARARQHASQSASTYLAPTFQCDALCSLRWMISVSSVFQTRPQRTTTATTPVGSPPSSPRPLSDAMFCGTFALFASLRFHCSRRFRSTRRGAADQGVVTDHPVESPLSNPSVKITPGSEKMYSEPLRTK